MLRLSPLPELQANISLAVNNAESSAVQDMLGISDMLAPISP